MRFLILWLLLMPCVATTTTIRHPTYKTVERYLQKLCGRYTREDLHDTILTIINDVLKRKKLKRIKGSMKFQEDHKTFCLYACQKPKGRLRSFSITYTKGEPEAIITETIPSKAVETVFKFHRQRLGQSPTPYDHTSRSLQELWGAFGHSPQAGLLSSIAIAGKLLEDANIKHITPQITSALHSMSWNSLTGMIGMWFVDGYTFILRVPTSYKDQDGYIDCPLQLTLDASGMYDVQLAKEPFWYPR